jgi:hypothetical protein
MTNDPLLDKLARFTPNAASVDNAALLFATGRASARTPWVWKVAVAGLLLANAGWLSVLAFGPKQEGVPISVPPITPAAPATPQTEPDSLPSSNPPPLSDDPWSYRALHSIDDPEKLPHSGPLQNEITTDKHLTPRTAHRGEID